ncbi:hypothetical protein [Amycolatopsis aidingensis]|uniref:hypothetical protein n=1 Tax=Amycolatopsis aidingensis TaxID=2842453 RepID=UPI001C0CE509|nr:hypothetical protein [Amycolatopsis aidingensis]
MLVLTIGLAAAQVPAGTSVARECAWPMTPLPVPADAKHSSVASAASGGWFVGSVTTSGTRQVRWHNGEMEVLGRALGQQTFLDDINASGVAVGHTVAHGALDDPIVYRDGAYARLPIPAGMRRVRPWAINNAGDIVGSGYPHPVADYVSVVLWPATNPDTPLVINPDPARYDYASPVDIDEQGRILIATDDKTDGDRPGGGVWHPDGTFREIPPLTPDGWYWFDGFRNGRIVGTASQRTAPRRAGVELDLNGRLVHQFGERVAHLRVDSGTTTVGSYVDPAKDYNLGIWDDGVLTHTLVTTDDYNHLPHNTVLTDDGVLAATLDSSHLGSTRAVTYRRTC